MNYKKFLVVLLAFASMQVSAQDMVHYKQVIKELSSAKYQGRGYAKGGANKAGMFLKREYEKAGVDEVTLQPFKLDINTVPGKMDVSVILNSQLAQDAPSILNIDGISILPTLTGKGRQRKHDHLYWEFHETDMLGVRQGDWKLVVKDCCESLTWWFSKKLA